MKKIFVNVLLFSVIIVSVIAQQNVHTGDAVFDLQDTSFIAQGGIVLTNAEKFELKKRGKTIVVRKKSIFPRIPKALFLYEVEKYSTPYTLIGTKAVPGTTSFSFEEKMSPVWIIMISGIVVLLFGLHRHLYTYYTSNEVYLFDPGTIGVFIVIGVGFVVGVSLVLLINKVVKSDITITVIIYSLVEIILFFAMFYIWNKKMKSKYQTNETVDV